MSNPNLTLISQIKTTRDTTKLLSFSDEELLVITRDSLSSYHKEVNPFNLREGVTLGLENVSRVLSIKTALS